MIKVVGCLTAEHVVGILGLTERVVDTAPVWIGMITALMVKRMPLCTANKLTRSAIEPVVSLGKRKSLYLHRAFTPAARCTVVVVMRIPVVDILTKFAGKDILTRSICLLIVAGPSVDKIIVFLHPCRVHVGCGNRSARIGIFILCNLKGLK